MYALPYARAHVDDAREQATLLVIYNIKHALLQQVLAQAPVYPRHGNHLVENNSMKPSTPIIKIPGDSW